MAARLKPHALVWYAMQSVPLEDGGGPAKCKDLSKNHYIIYNMLY